MMNRLKPVFRHVEDKKALFQRSRCLLTISVGQEVHESEHFESTIELVNNAFDSCIMLIDDSLQRHTMALESKHDAAYFYKPSMDAGDQWLSRNAIYYDKLDILDEIVRWDKWLEHADYKTNQAEILDLMCFDKTYNNVFTNTVDDFLNRYYRRLQDKANFQLARAKQLCLDYLVEECTAMSLWPELNCQFEVYPSPRNLAMAETHKRFVIPHYPDLLYPVSIKFKNRKQFKPQKLEVVE